MMTRPPRISRAVPLSAKQPDPKRNSTHLTMIRALPCLKCGRIGETEAAHVRSGTDGGMGMKPADRWTVPLCRACHPIPARRAADRGAAPLRQRRLSLRRHPEPVRSRLRRRAVRDDEGDRQWLRHRHPAPGYST